MTRLWIIGPGAVGKTLGRLFHDHAAFEIAGVIGRDRARAEAARDFIGEGQVLGFDDAIPVQAGDVVMLSVSDGAIEAAASRLTNPSGLTVFHCSGARDLSPLESLRQGGAAVASLHPVKAFADPAREILTFKGVACALQGDAAAVAKLSEAVTRIVGEPVILPEAVDRRLYHAGAVFASNYLTTLVQAALDSHAAAGIGEADSLRLLSPILRDALGAILERGPVQALTGPIARGDAITVEAQVEALAAHDPALADLYLALGRKTLELSRRKSPDLDLSALKQRLGRSPGP